MKYPAASRSIRGRALRARDGLLCAPSTRRAHRSGPRRARYVWAVNITGDGRLVVAAYSDGTIRWHRMSDGVELLAFMPLADRTNWVAWTPEGFYAATAGAQGVLRWHVNRGWNAPDSVPIEDIPGSYRPAVLPLVLQELETPRALGLAAMAEHNREVMLRTNSHVPPGARLHLLAIGISAYNEEYAKNLRLHYAARDANDLASAIVNTQGSLYQVKPRCCSTRTPTGVALWRRWTTCAGHGGRRWERSRGGPLLRTWRDGGRQVVSAALRGRCRDDASIKATACRPMT